MGVVARDPAGSIAEAEAAGRAGDWAGAAARWEAFHRANRGRGSTRMAEARAALKAGRAAQAERALRRAVDLTPDDPEPWRLWLDLLRVEDRAVEAQSVGWRAYAAVPPAARRGVLRSLTLALLAEPPDDAAVAALDRFIAADPSDLDARVARLRRVPADPRAGDPGRAARAAELEALLARDPGHVDAREALADALAEAGRVDRGRAILDGWPASSRDARFDRLAGRWALEYEHRPDLAVAGFRRALAELPHDARTHYRLARALSASGRPAEARAEADALSRLRELLDPAPLGRRLADDLARLDEPSACLDLADLCSRAGLSRLADAWRREAAEARSRGEGR